MATFPLRPSVEAMRWSTIASTLLLLLASVQRASSIGERRGVGPCPSDWIPQGEQGNGCPLLCLNEATGEKLHLLVRYTLKGVVLRGCQQCEVRWIEGTDCVLVICPEEDVPCPGQPKTEVTPHVSKQGQTRASTSMPISLLRRVFTNATVIRMGSTAHRPHFPVPIFPLRQTTRLPQTTTTKKVQQTERESTTDSPRPPPTTTIIDNVDVQTPPIIEQQTANNNLMSSTEMSPEKLVPSDIPITPSSIPPPKVPVFPPTSPTVSLPTPSPIVKLEPENIPGPAAPPKVKTEYRKGTRFQPKK